MYIKVTTYEGSIRWFYIDEILGINKKCIVKIPCRREKIKEIAVSCNLPYENRTKIFNGVQRGNGKKFIFSNTENFDENKYAVYNEKGHGKFEKLERFWI